MKIFRKKTGDPAVGTYAERRIAAPKGAIFLAAAAAALGDLFALIAVACGGYGGAYILAPVVLLLADAAFFAAALFTNFRFRYAVAEYLLYAAVAIAASGAMVGGMSVSGGTIATNTAKLLWMTFHVIAAGAAAFAAFGASRARRPIRLAALALSAVAAVLMLFYSAFVLASGVFGQPFAGGRRALVYAAAEDGSGYVVTGAVKGRGDRAVVPETFDGQPVVGVDCALFLDESVKSVSIEGAETELQNVGLLDRFPADSDLAVAFVPERAQEIRDRWFESARISGNAARLNFANRVRPIAEKGKVYVTFTYTMGGLGVSGGRYVPIWIADKGTAFDPAFCAAAVLAMGHTQKTQSDLEWCYRSNGKYAIAEIGDAEGPLSGRAIGSNVDNVLIDYEKVFSCRAAGSNDAKYSFPSSLSSFYAVASRAGEFLSAAERKGFSLDWKYASSAGGTQRALTTDFKALLEAESGNELWFYANYALDAPELGTLGFDKSLPVYGDTVTASCHVAPHAADGVGFTYSWTAPDGSRSSDTNELVLSSVRPDRDSGEYVLTVTASGSTTALTSSGTVRAKLNVSKKPLTADWGLTAVMKYNAAERQISPTLSGTVPGDSVQLDVSRSSARDVGSYSVTATLNGNWGDLYTLSNPSFSFTIAPMEVQVKWTLEGAGGGFSVVYDGGTHCPALSIDKPFPSDDFDVQRREDAAANAKNAGNYTVYAEKTGSQAKNYTLTNASRLFTISRRPVRAVWDETTSHTYDGTVFCPKVASVTGGAGADGDLKEKLTYSGDTNVKNAGTNYRVRAALDDGNYTLSDGECPFTISPRAVRAEWDGTTSHMYDGTVFCPKVARVTGGAGADGDLTGKLTYSGDTNVKNAGDNYRVRASLDDGNYTLSDGECSFTISPRALTVALRDRTVTYGDPLDGTAVTEFDADGLASGDAAAEVFALTYRVTAKNAGYYAGGLDAAYANGAKGANYAISVTKANLTIGKRETDLTWRALSFTYDGAEHKPTALGMTNPASGEVSAALASLEYEYGGGNCVDKGNYTVTAKFPEGSNYKFAGESESKQWSFVIAALKIRLGWDPDSLEATPSPALPDGVRIEYEYLSEGGDSLGSEKPAEAGSYRVRAKLVGEKSANCEIEGSAEYSFTIEAEEEE